MRFKSSLPQSQSQGTGIRWKHRISETIWSSRCSHLVHSIRRFKSPLPQSHDQVTGIQWKHRIPETIRSSRCSHLLHSIRRHEIQELSATIPCPGHCGPMETQDFRNHQELA
ncbi:unnamed protein product, partial [Nesidiocoris tenuis]